MNRFLAPAAALAFMAAGAAHAEDATVTVHMRGLTPNKGQVIVMLFDSNENYDASKAAQSQKAATTGSAQDVSFTGVAPGRYAIKAFYDYDGNNQYDPGTDFIGFSNQAQMSDSAHIPTFSETSFMVKPGANRQQITVYRVK